MSKTKKSGHSVSESDMAAQDQIIKDSLSLVKHKFMVMSGKGGVGKTSVAANLAMAMNIPFLGRIPLDPKMVQCADAGESYMEKYPDSEVTKAYNQVVAKIMQGG